MTGFELQTSGIASNRSTNWATTTGTRDPSRKSISNLNIRVQQNDMKQIFPNFVPQLSHITTGVHWSQLL